MRRAMHSVSLAVVLLCAGRASANTELLKTSSGSLVHWTRAEISVGLTPSAGSKTVAEDGVVLAIQRAAKAWNAVRAGQPRLHFVSEPDPQVTIKFCRGKWRGDTIDLGKSQFTASLRDGTVTAATVELNECDHTFTAPDEVSTGRYDLQSVMTHELGHVLGLGHSDNRAAIMYPSGGGAGVRKPHTEDVAALTIIYFGRSTAEDGREIATGDARILPDPHPISPRPGDGALAPAPARPASGPPASANDPRGAVDSAPADQVSVLSLTISGGRQVMVYTCEPTLLPPIGAAPSPQDSKRSSGHRARNNAR